MWLLMWNPTPWPNHWNQWTRAWLSGRKTSRPCGLDFSKACFTRCPIMGSPVVQTRGSRASWEINKLSCWWYEVELCAMGLRGALRQCSWPRIVCPIHQWPATTAYLQTEMFEDVIICQCPISTAEDQAILQNDLNNFCMGNEKADGTCASTRTDVTS